MPSHRVMLICSRHLFGESMETILRAADGVELIGPWDMNEDVCARIGEVQPDVVVVVADEDIRGEESTRLTAAIIEQYPELPVIRANLSENVVRIFSTHILPARGTDLLETIRNLPIVSVGKSSNERSE
jgi:DNA-binding NarL/FixJ family response regulator